MTARAPLWRARVRIVSASRQYGRINRTLGNLSEAASSIREFGDADKIERDGLGTGADRLSSVAIQARGQSKRGDKGRADRKFLEAVLYFTVNNISWQAVPAEFGPVRPVEHGLETLLAAQQGQGCSRPCSITSPPPARARVSSSCPTAPSRGRTSRPPAPKGAGG